MTLSGLTHFFLCSLFRVFYLIITLFLFQKWNRTKCFLHYWHKGLYTANIPVMPTQEHKAIDWCALLTISSSHFKNTMYASITKRRFHSLRFFLKISFVYKTHARFPPRPPILCVPHPLYNFLYLPYHIIPLIYLCIFRLQTKYFLMSSLSIPLKVVFAESCGKMRHVIHLADCLYSIFPLRYNPGLLGCFQEIFL